MTHLTAFDLTFKFSKFWAWVCKTLCLMHLTLDVANVESYTWQLATFCFHLSFFEIISNLNYFHLRIIPLIVHGFNHILIKLYCPLMGEYSLINCSWASRCIRHYILYVLYLTQEYLRLTIQIWKFSAVAGLLCQFWSSYIFLIHPCLYKYPRTSAFEEDANLGVGGCGIQRGEILENLRAIWSEGICEKIRKEERKREKRENFIFFRSIPSPTIDIPFYAHFMI